MNSCPGKKYFFDDSNAPLIGVTPHGNVNSAETERKYMQLNASVDDLPLSLCAKSERQAKLGAQQGTIILTCVPSESQACSGERILKS